MTTERNIIIHAGQTFELSLDYAGTAGRGQRMHIRASDAAADVIAILTHDGDANARVVYDGTNFLDITIGASVNGGWLVGSNRVEWVYDIEDYDLSDTDDVVIAYRGKAIVYGNRTRPEDVTPSAALPSGDGRYVRFDGVQGLTDAQKLQARENIGAGTGGSGSGDVVGPASATDDRIAAFDGATGKLIKQGTVTATAVASHLSNTSNPHSVTAAQVGADPAGTAASAVSTHNTVTTGAHGMTAFGASLVDDADASAARTTLGLGTAATAATGDFAAASHTHAASDVTSGTFDAARLPAATTSASGAVELATVAECQAGTDTTRATTPEGVAAAIAALASGGSPGGSSGQLQYNNASAFGGAPLWREDANTVAQRNSTTTQVAYWYKTYTDASNYERLALVPGAASGWMQIAAQTAGTGTDNINVAITPAGTGGVGAHVPDSASTGGNARGANAVDWQTSRTAANQVASGVGAVIGGGRKNLNSSAYGVVGGGDLNTATGNYGVIGGGFSNTLSGDPDGSTIGGGRYNSNSGQDATIAGGNSNTASGQLSWIPGGTRATTRGLYGAGAYASGRRSADGDAQVMRQVVRRTTTDATPVNLATDGTPAATTVMVLPSDSVATVVATVTAVVNAAGVISMAGWEIKAVAKNDSSTMTLTGGTATAIGTADAALATATCALVVDGTRDSVEVQVTGVAATTIYWVAEVKIVQAL